MSIVGTLQGIGANEPPVVKKYNSSYENRNKMTDLQLLANVSKFMDRKAFESDLPPIILCDDEVREDFIAKPNPSLDSHLQNVFNPGNDYSDIQQKSAKTNNVVIPTYLANELIGGLDTNNEMDRYKTNTQIMMNGEGMKKKSSVGLKKVLKKGEEAGVTQQIISPITNLPMVPQHTLEEVASKRRQEAEDELLIAEMKLEEEKGLGFDPILRKLKVTLGNRGAKGLAGLAKRFRIMDDDNSGDLNMPEFRKAMRECKMGISDEDVTSLFNIFDIDKSGSISYNEFVSALAGQMNLRRRRLVDLAFNVLDKDKNGCIELNDIAAAYDVSKHPEYTSGKRTQENILLEFLDGFDVGGEKDAKVTKQEFQNYYRNLSASIESDNYFELMIRNAWHISGGDGESQNSSNIRVLVTHSDGTQSVQALLNDIGVNPGNKREIVQRLRMQGVDVMAIPGFTDKGSPAAEAAAQNLNVNIFSSQTKEVNSTSGGNKSANLRNQVMAGRKRGVTNLSLPILDKLRAALKKRGARGFNGIQRAFRIIDDDNSGQLSTDEFKKALHEMNILLSENHFFEIFAFFDQDGSNTISYDEFIMGLRGPIPGIRKKLVLLAFDVLDKDKNGFIEPTDLAGSYDASRHPEVLSGSKTSSAVLREFLDNFDVGGEVDGKVTREEFINYYTNISASIDNDDYFELMIRNAWHISGGVGTAANTSNRRVLVTRPDGTQGVEEIKNDLGISSDDKKGMVERLRKQGINAKNIELYGASEEADYTNRIFSPKVPGAPNTVPPYVRKAPPVSRQHLSSNTPSTYMSSGDTVSSKNAKDGSNPFPVSNTGSAIFGVAGAISRMKEQIKKRGVHGFVGIQRKFAIMDDDGNKALTFEELKYGMHDLGIKMSDDDLHTLFTAMDSDKSGNVEFEEFISAIRDPLSSRRLAMVNLAYTVLDKDGNEIIDAADVAQSFNASRHPEVLSGSKTSSAVLREFLDNFDVGGEVDGKVTREEFINYYTNISASIDNDDYFELMIRNAWHISGGVGTAANTSNRRVLVTRPDGTQGVEEIKNDLGISSDDKKGMVERLRKQGINAKNIELYGASEEADYTKENSGIHMNVSKDDVQAAILELKNNALQFFNDNDYNRAEETFIQVRDLLQQLYLDSGHPEIVKCIKSIQLCSKKANAANKSN